MGSLHAEESGDSRPTSDNTTGNPGEAGPHERRSDGLGLVPTDIPTRCGFYSLLNFITAAEIYTASEFSFSCDHM